MSAHLQDELLTAALDGTLSAADREAVDAHLEVCARCREDLELARGARSALRSLPDEIRPPIDVAAAVAAQVGGGGASAGAPTGPPRWYRAAGLVAAAAAILLGVMVLPRVIGDEAQERSNMTVAAGADTGSASEAGATVPKESTGVFGAQTDFNATSLQALADDTARTTSMQTPSTSTPEALTSDAAALDCIRSAAGASIPPDAIVLRVLHATYLGTPADIAVFSLPDGHVVAWAARRHGCVTLGSSTSA